MPSESPRRSEATETEKIKLWAVIAAKGPNHPAAPRRLKPLPQPCSVPLPARPNHPAAPRRLKRIRNACPHIDFLGSESPRRSEATETKSGEGPRRHQLQQSESPRRSEATETQFAAFFARLMVCGPNHPAAPRRLKPETTEFSVALALSSESPRRSEATETFGPDAVEEAAGAVRITPPLRGD